MRSLKVCWQQMGEYRELNYIVIRLQLETYTVAHINIQSSGITFSSLRWYYAWLCKAAAFPGHVMRGQQ